MADADASQAMSSRSKVSFDKEFAAESSDASANGSASASASEVGSQRAEAATPMNYLEAIPATPAGAEATGPPDGSTFESNE